MLLGTVRITTITTTIFLLCKPSTGWWLYFNYSLCPYDDGYTRCFKYDRDCLHLFTHKSVPVIFEPPCIMYLQLGEQVVTCSPKPLNRSTLGRWVAMLIPKSLTNTRRSTHLSHLTLAQGGGECSRTYMSH